MIDCPACGGGSTVVAHSRAADTIERTRQCRDCGHRWLTVEIEKTRLHKVESRSTTGGLTPHDRKTLAAALPVLEKMAGR